MSQELDYVRRQYAGQKNLQVRIQTHVRYTRPQVDFTAWVMDQLDWRGDEWVIDVGAGDGQYASLARARGGVYLAADLHMGMLRDLDDAGLMRLNMDAAAAPLVDNCLDVLLANHMLYYVPDLDQALAGFARILRPGGRLLAATNSGRYMGELHSLHAQVAAEFGYADKLETLNEARGFTLENGRPPLARHFQSVERFDLASELVFPEAQPAVDYLASIGDRLFDLLPPGASWSDVTVALKREMERCIVEQGDFRVSKLAGVFVCHN